MNQTLLSLYRVLLEITIAVPMKFASTQRVLIIQGIDEKWTTGLGLLMVVAGVGFKMSAIYGTGIIQDKIRF